MESKIDTANIESGPVETTIGSKAWVWFIAVAIGLIVIFYVSSAFAGTAGRKVSCAATQNGIYKATTRGKESTPQIARLEKALHLPVAAADKVRSTPVSTPTHI